MKTVIIDYGSGNLRSAAKAFESVSRTNSIEVSNNAKSLASASHIVLPGVGAFADCLAGLKIIPGMLDALEENVRVQKKWFLGICVGMQLLFEKGYENGEQKGMGWIPGNVEKIAASDKSLKIPHMGWNELQIKKTSPLFKNIEPGAHAYFVHSYHAQCPGDFITASAEYGQEITAAVERDNVFGVQFHPEKSQATGLALISNFLTL